MPARDRPRRLAALHDAWALARPFWVASDQRPALALLASVIALTLAGVWLNVRFSAWTGLARLLPERDLARAWSRVLSPGEQQRLQFARVLLHMPDWVFLDEATSALDEPAEQALYECLRRELPGTTIVSVGHRSTLRRLHDEQWLLGPRPVAETTPQGERLAGLQL
jgi:ABC-type uncharacterized transport system fused permease/ATPase subunit